MRFLGLELSGDVPDARTVWAFRESLKEHHLADALFERLNQVLADLGVELKSGQIIDATFVPVPTQRNGREDNALINGEPHEIGWNITRTRHRVCKKQAEISCPFRKFQKKLSDWEIFGA